MAFILQTAFLPRTHSQCSRASFTSSQRPHVVMAANISSADAMQFFRHREGEWDSWRVTHHLAFRRSESGESRITMKCLDKADEQVVSLCNDWDVDPATAQGGCYVTWRATMAWDQEGENHEGSTVFALVPDDGDIRKGRILRDRGYAEIVPIAGTYYLDENDSLNLETPYDGGAVTEQFSFDGPDVVNRMSTVRRFGGFSTATFSTERRLGSETVCDDEDSIEDIANLFEEMSLFGGIKQDEEEEVKSSLIGANRFGNRSLSSQPSANSAFGSEYATTNSEEKPSVNSAFSSGFGGSADAKRRNGDSNTDTQDAELIPGVSAEAMEAAQKVGIDLTKIPPSMRDDFVASFNNDNAKRSER